MNLLSNDSIKLLKKQNNKIKIEKISKNKYFKDIKNKLFDIYDRDINLKDIEIVKVDYRLIDDSYFVGKSIQNKMMKLKFTYKIKYKNIKVDFITSKNLHYVKNRIFKIIKIIDSIKKLFNRASAFQKVIIYDINEKKKLPNKNNKTIIPDNCNSGYCNVMYNKNINGNIVLYRNEEFYKVLIHELIHANFIDYQIIINQNVKNMDNDICINYNILLNEAFTETFSCLLNIILINYETKINVDILFKNEVIFMLNTYNKILHYFDIKKIEDIIVKYGCKKYFKQETNAFSYYVLKFLNYIYINEFLKLMEKYTNKNYSIKNGTYNKKYIGYVFKNIYSLNKYIEKSNLNDRSLRLTLYELKI